MAIARLLACTFIAGLCSGGVSAESFKAELARRSAIEGLGIVTFARSSKLEFISLDGRESSLEVPGLEFVYDVRANEQVILGGSKGLRTTLQQRGFSGFLTAGLALFSLEGRTPTPVGLAGPLNARISPRGDLIAALSFTTATRVELRYGSLDWNSTQEVFSDDFAAIGNYSWSPDQRFLAYSDHGQIYVFDISKSERRAIAHGSNPEWSPDGKSIAYIGPNRDLMVYDIGTGAERRLTRFYNVIGFPKWSPDSQYLFFTESNPLLALRNLLTLPGSDFDVIRISDGATATVYTPGMGADNRRFFWAKIGSKATHVGH